MLRRKFGSTLPSGYNEQSVRCRACVSHELCRSAHQQIQTAAHNCSSGSGVAAGAAATASATATSSGGGGGTGFFAEIAETLRASGRAVRPFLALAAFVGGSIFVASAIGSKTLLRQPSERIQRFVDSEARRKSLDHISVLVTEPEDDEIEVIDTPFTPEEAAAQLERLDLAGHNHDHDHDHDHNHEHNHTHAHKVAVPPAKSTMKVVRYIDQFEGNTEALAAASVAEPDPQQLLQHRYHHDHSGILDRISATLFPRSNTYSALRDSVVLGNSIARDLDRALSAPESPERNAVLERHRANIQHELGHIAHNDQIIQYSAFAGSFVGSYLIGYNLISPSVRAACARYTVRSALPFVGANVALLMSSLYVARNVSIYLTRRAETLADDEITDPAAIKAMIDAFAEEDKRAQAWMRYNGIYDPQAQKRMYLREDPRHPPLPDRIDHLVSRLEQVSTSSAPSQPAAPAS